MSSYAVRKRSNPYSSGPSQGGPAKRPKNRAFIGPMNRPGGGGPRSGARLYVQRTPGGAIVAENHYFDTQRESTAIQSSATTWAGAEADPNTSAMLCLFAPVIGDDIFNRSGRRVLVKKIRITGKITVPAQTAQTAQDAAASCRLVCYQDMQTNATQATGDLVLLQGAANGAVNMGMNVANLGRFRVLKEKVILLNPPDYSGLTTAFVAAGRVYHFKMNLKINVFVNYNATNGGTVADIVDNSFHFLALTNTNPLAAVLEYKVRTVFSP